MNLYALFLGRTVVLNVPDGYLVFDGENFVEPTNAKTVALTETFQVDVTPEAYPIKNGPVQSPFRSSGYWVCLVTSGASTTPKTPITAPDPTGGVCICGITCFGTRILNVPITEGP